MELMCDNAAFARAGLAGRYPQDWEELYAYARQMTIDPSKEPGGNPNDPVQYGINEGLLAVIVATVVLLAGNLPPQKLSQDLYAYMFSICLNPLMWIPSALTLGSLRTRQIRDRSELNSSLARSRQESDALAQAYQRLSRITTKLESRLAGKHCTVFTAFQAAKLTARNSVQDVLDGAPQLPAGDVVAAITVTIAEQQELIEGRLAKGRKLLFREVLSQAASRVEVIVTLLALLELIKRDRVRVWQDEQFGPIYIEQQEPEEDDADEAPMDEPAA